MKTKNLNQKINICFEVDNKNQINQTLLIPIPNDTLNNATIFNKNNAIIDSLTNAILRKIVQLVAFQQNLNLLEQDVYIPAARTGLMFGLHDIVQSTLERDNAQLSFLSNKEVSSNSSKLTAPIKKFISDLNRSSRFGLWHLDSEETPLTKLMEGSINFDEEKSSFEFRPKNLKSTLPLAASSSLVTELAAFDILCSDVIFNAPEFLIFEEPEAHLHLSAQRDIAKIIVSLVNQGTHVLLTSHSDTFLQQLNNLILLHRLKETNMPYQLGIKDNEMIDEEKVALYDFTNQEGRTMVKNIPCSKYGFIAPSLNEVLKSLQLETTDILNKIDESE
ncbi:hypothetical protein V757_03075 [Pelistega indica]|uniref:Endonuclease GajA/Old nuclease/RecF-like AAA domain-containing protein n=1 Tax=Pelistega indica TaxID=1414851 RepID=V8GAD0_9BURK|nr:AAA family ATPase [Pelistega indica]ETD72647.1 hypothetical protein V757_03075 [Pelistega indica]